MEKELGDRIREQNLAGVKVDEDYQEVLSIMERWRPRSLGFTGSDNQGIIGLEVYI